MKFILLFFAAIVTLLPCKELTAAMSKNFNLDFDHVPGELIIKFKNTNQRSQLTTLQRLGFNIQRTYKSSGAHLIRVAKKTDESNLLKLAKQLASRPDVAYVEANTILYMDEKKPNDPRFDELYGLKNTGSTGGSQGSDISAPAAWTQTTGSSDILVGVIDTGVDYTHPDLKENYWFNPGETGTDEQGRDKRQNGVDDDGNGYVDDFRGWDFVNNDNDPMDDNNHGTHCAGTIGGKGNNKIGVTGVNWNVSLVGLKFISASGSGSLDHAIQAIDYATGIGADLTSNSWGGGGYSNAMAEAIEKANSAGVLFVAAAGNSSANNDTDPHYPSSYPHDNIIAVAATDHNDRLASFSCYGANSVDVAAPGVDILSTVAGQKYDKYSGTSMATPHVAGLAALIKSHYMNADANEIKFRILSNTDYVAGLRGKVLTSGRVNAEKALEEDTAAPAPITDMQIVANDTNSFTVRWRVSGDDGTNGFAKAYDIRIAATPIKNEQDWRKAQSVGVVYDHVSGGSTHSQYEVKNLPFNSSGYVVIRAIDNVGNQSDLSSSLAFAVRGVSLITSYTADDLNGVKPEAPWNIQSNNGVTSYTDSPSGNYASNSNTSLVIDKIKTDNKILLLSFDTRYEIESNYDYGYVEISTDGGRTFKELMKVTGSESVWQNKALSLGSFSQSSDSITVRFRLASDSSINADGWYIDNVSFFEAL